MNYFAGDYITYPYHGFVVSTGVQNNLQNYLGGLESSACNNGDLFAFETSHEDYANAGGTFYEVGWRAYHQGTGGANDYMKWFEEAYVGGNQVANKQYTPLCSFPLDGYTQSTWKVYSVSTGSTTWVGFMGCADGDTQQFDKINMGQKYMVPLGEAGKFGNATDDYEAQYSIDLRDSGGNWIAFGNTTNDCNIAFGMNNGYLHGYPSDNQFFTDNGTPNC